MDNARESAGAVRAARGTASRGGRGSAAARRSAICAAAAIASVGLAAAGCSTASHPVAAPAPTVTAAAPPTTAAPTALAPTTAVTPVATTSPSVPASPAAAVPTLGQPAGVFAHGQGFGQVKPSTIFNGGDPTGLVTHVAWTSWGGAQAVATGISDYVGPSQTVAGGKQEAATVVAFNLGACDGKLMYQAVEWYFPQHHQAFNPGRYENICTGTYVPGS